MSAFLVAVAACLIDGTPFFDWGWSRSRVFLPTRFCKTTTAPMTSQPGRSAVDCAFKCEFSPEETAAPLSSLCPETKLCLLSGASCRIAEFAAVAPTGLVYRKKLDKGPNPH
uniref:Secreted protein n=1 Tax=Macrostomum lignano TaxID=282301 RepID=A0A1I8FEJ4_9PLAT